MFADADKSNADSISVQNITYSGYFETYIELDGHPDLIAPYITSNGTIKLYGYQIEVLSGDSTAYGATITMTSGMTVLNGDVNINIIDGIAYYKGCMLEADQAYTTGNNICNLQVLTSATHYITAYNLTKDEHLILYTYENYLRTSFSIASGDQIIIPGFSFPIN